MYFLGVEISYGAYTGMHLAYAGDKTLLIVGVPNISAQLASMIFVYAICIPAHPCVCTMVH